MNARAVTLILISAAACGPSGEPARSADSLPAPDQDCTALETRTANAPQQQPAFPGQTRACEVDSNVAFDVVVLARDLVHPWAVEPLPDGSLLVTERPGRMRVISQAGVVGAPLTGLPAVDAGGQGGLLDVALSPNFDSDRTIFWSYTEPRQGGNGTAVARGVLSDDRRRVGAVRVIFRALPTYDNSLHFGSRLAFGPDGKLFVTLGERSDKPMRQHAQRLDSHLGKIVRINADGSVPEDNPLVGRANARPEIWTLGHRNVQAAAFDPEGRLWIVEHGTRGGDELNLIEKGANYGWPVQAYGEEYSGQPIPGSSPAPPNFDFEQPRYYWDPVSAPSGAQFYTGSAFPAWRGSLFIGGLVSNGLVRVTLDDDEKVTGEEHLLESRGQRVRDVRQGADGALYVVTDEGNGQLWKLVPQR
ncbi:MAG: PQQ-dependent sugar dehydrogenase [Gemmatimonadota bacterium]